MRVICDAAVLIGLAKIGKLNLLEKLYEKIYIPWGVYNEVVVRGRSRPGAEEIDQAKLSALCHYPATSNEQKYLSAQNF